jgi:cephalosporin hydroxylase
MSTEKIWGGWDTPPENNPNAFFAFLWHHLAAQHVGTPQQVNNFGLSQRRHEITSLWELYHRAQPKVVVEIGVAQGGTWASWCHLGQPDALLIGIDRCVDDCRPRRGDPVSSVIARPHLMDRSTSQGGGMYACAKDNQRIVPINGWSYDPHVLSQLQTALAGKKVDWLFHDASHSADMARKDYELYRPFMAEGSVMAFHDIQASKVPECNKSVWWAEVKRDGDYSACFEFLGSKGDDSMGIGVLIF